MFQTLTIVQKGEAVAVGLQQYIDNRCGDLLIGLRSITYTVGWYNIDAGESFSWRSSTWGVSGASNTTDIHPGLYGFAQLHDTIKAENSNTLLDVSKVNGLITLTVGNGSEVLLTDGLLSLLGLDDGLGGQWLNAGTYAGDRPVNFASTKMLYVHLDQINTTSNVLDGAPSTLLAIIAPGCHLFGDINFIRVKHPEFKRLGGGTVSELKVSIRDDSGKILDNHGLPISLVLEIAGA